MFGASGVKDILMNPLYIGKIRYNVRENWSEKRRKGTNKSPIIADGEHEAIIPIELWDKVQELYKMKSGKPKKTFESNYILTGLMKCPVCWYSMLLGTMFVANGGIKVLPHAIPMELELTMPKRMYYQGLKK